MLKYLIAGVVVATAMFSTADEAQAHRRGLRRAVVVPVYAPRYVAPVRSYYRAPVYAAPAYSRPTVSVQIGRPVSRYYRPSYRYPASRGVGVSIGIGRGVGYGW
ncbi:hypothetical protein K227x_37550 [Rubripirellula lacrimiformis]|uniref:Uncharacterized protein n=1 Tax=Rubripirellula lacrimiformis TaxID=1930273 RepID=A0A517NE04_9BACT|nr:hypothetical protein [Rubripirellula lacrimiformis]QDT05355.1 hypothetical protein K227x_37550 [Rubripirellula lacrimiformis]